MGGSSPLQGEDQKPRESGVLPPSHQIPPFQFEVSLVTSLHQHQPGICGSFPGHVLVPSKGRDHRPAIEHQTHLEKTAQVNKQCEVEASCTDKWDPCQTAAGRFSQNVKQLFLLVLSADCKLSQHDSWNCRLLFWGPQRYSWQDRNGCQHLPGSNRKRRQRKEWWGHWMNYLICQIQD